MKFRNRRCLRGTLWIKIDNPEFDFNFKSWIDLKTNDVVVIVNITVAKPTSVKILSRQGYSWWYLETFLHNFKLLKHRKK